MHSEKRAPLQLKSRSSSPLSSVQGERCGRRASLPLSCRVCVLILYMCSHTTYYIRVLILLYTLFLRRNAERGELPCVCPVLRGPLLRCAPSVDFSRGEKLDSSGLLVKTRKKQITNQKHYVCSTNKFILVRKKKGILFPNQNDSLLCFSFQVPPQKVLVFWMHVLYNMKLQSFNRP